jgi:DNA-binding transcriptional ArsR family regulator
VSGVPSDDPGRTIEVFRALSHPMRCRMLAEIAAHDELPRSELEESMGLPADTASYHLKILVSAEVVRMRRRGRNAFYSLRRDVVAGVQDQLFALARTSLQLVPAVVPAPQATAARAGAVGR